MVSDIEWAGLLAMASIIGPVCQMGTTVIAAAVGVVTFRYTRRQSALALINQTNNLANIVTAAARRGDGLGWMNVPWLGA